MLSQSTEESPETQHTLFIRDVPDWTRMLSRTDTPLLKCLGPVPKIGEQNQYGQTYLGMSDPVDADEMSFAQGMQRIYGDILAAVSDDAFTEDEEGYEVFADSLEGTIAQWAADQQQHWRSIERRNGPQEQWEGERIAPKTTMTWGLPLTERVTCPRIVE